MDFYVYQLNYANREGLEKALTDRGILIEVEGELVKGPDTLAIVHLGYPVLTPAVLGESGDVITEATYSTRYHCDIKTKGEHSFPSSVHPKIATPFHGAKWREGAKNL